MVHGELLTLLAAMQLALLPDDMIVTCLMKH